MTWDSMTNSHMKKLFSIDNYYKINGSTAPVFWVPVESAISQYVQSLDKYSFGALYLSINIHLDRSI